VADYALEIDGLSYAYSRDSRALDGVGLEVARGSFTALLGPNGAGKTTLMALVTRLFQAREGTIRVCGLDLAKNPRQALAAMGVVFQRPTVDMDLTVDQNLRYAASLQGIPTNLAKERITWALGHFEIADRRKTPVRALSGGLRRRVEVARALLHEPKLLILDEPTVGLDIDSRRAMVEYVHALCTDRRLAVLWTTHLIDEVWPGDRVVVIHAGRVRSAGGIEEVLAEAGAQDLGDAYRRLTSGTMPGQAEQAA
jgi:ABC-2 type transport system ATP-binding protein